MYLLSLAFFAVCFISVVISEQSINQEEEKLPDCSEKALFRCAYPLEFKKLHFTSSRKELDLLCRDLHSGLRCIDSFTRNCFEPHQRSHFNSLYSGTSMVIHNICKSGPYQEEFLKHSPCLNNLTSDYEVCAKNYQFKIEEIKTTISDTDKQVESLCCSLNVFLDCTKDSVSVKCGPESTAFASGFLDQMARSIIMVHCDKIPLGVCNAAYIPAINQFLLAITAIFVMHISS